MVVSAALSCALLHPLGVDQREVVVPLAAHLPFPLVTSLPTDGLRTARK